MKMRRLADTNVEKRLKAHYKKKATMSERLQQEIDSLNKEQVMGPNSGQPLKDYPAVGPGTIRVMQDLNATNEFGKEMSIVWDDTAEVIVDPFVALNGLQQMQQNPDLMPASADSVWSVMMSAADEAEAELPGDAADELYTVGAANLHAEERISLNELMSREAYDFDMQSDPSPGATYHDMESDAPENADIETAFIEYGELDIFVSVMTDDLFPNGIDGVDIEASEEALFKKIESIVLSLYPNAMVDVQPGASDGVKVNLQMPGLIGAGDDFYNRRDQWVTAKEKEVNEAVYDVLWETVREGDWEVAADPDDDTFGGMDYADY